MEKNKHVDGNVIEDSIRHVDEALVNAKEVGGEYWRMAKEKGENLISDAGDQSKKVWDQTKGYIQKHPAQAIGYAVLLGLAAGIFFSSKKQV